MGEYRFKIPKTVPLVVYCCKFPLKFYSNEHQNGHVLELYALKHKQLLIAIEFMTQLAMK